MKTAGAIAKRRTIFFMILCVIIACGCGSFRMRYLVAAGIAPYTHQGQQQQIKSEQVT